MKRSSFLFAAGLIVLAVASRILPHPHNFAPIGGLALFSAAYFRKNPMAFLLPIVAMWLSDLFINNVTYGAYQNGFTWFNSGMIFIYGSFLLIALVGYFLLTKISAGRVLMGSLSASVIFFAVSNFAVWLGSAMYPQTLAGFLACYTAAIPFFWNTLAGDLFYSAALIGSAEFAFRKNLIPTLR